MTNIKEQIKQAHKDSFKTKIRYRCDECGTIVGFVRKVRGRELCRKCWPIGVKNEQKNRIRKKT